MFVIYSPQIADELDTQTVHNSHCTFKVTASLVLVGQAGSDPSPPHTPGAVTVTVQVYLPADLINTGDMVVMLV